MTTVVFVHGTGVRASSDKDPFKIAFDLVSSKLRQHAKRSDLNLVPCFWGNKLGAKLHANGASIPEYDTARGLEVVSDEDYEISLWRLLYQDPLYELRVLSLRAAETTEFVFGVSSPGELLDERVRNFTLSETLRTKLDKAGITEVFTDARLVVVNSPVYYDALQGAPQELSEYRAAIARAIVAQAIHLSEQEQEQLPPLLDYSLRDEIVMLLIGELGDTDRSIADRVKKLVIANPLTMYMRRWRRKKMDDTHPFPGDVLLYQARGEPIRQFIRECIEQAAESNSPVVLLAHSLGGIASVDLLVLQESVRQQVKLLVTVGSQAPFLYEIGALYSLPFGQPLPPNFPRWLNIYDPNDFLSYVGDKNQIFRDRVQDIPVDNREPFHYAHSAYWKNDETWKAIVPEIP